MGLRHAMPSHDVRAWLASVRESDEEGETVYAQHVALQKANVCVFVHCRRLYACLTFSTSLLQLFKPDAAMPSHICISSFSGDLSSIEGDRPESGNTAALSCTAMYITKRPTKRASVFPRKCPQQQLGRRRHRRGLLVCHYMSHPLVSRFRLLLQE